ncbi:MAG TPA: 7-cyano-7-deazaguanine synthase QueC [Desulfurella acetivorans]|nr:7-cyano-7-deazaguanine synthase QueC [Desulfurella acetivorans]
MKKCLLIFSGGLDSTTCLFWALDYYDEVHTITFDYHQRHVIEKKMALETIKLAKSIKQKDIDYFEFNIDLSKIGASALTDFSINVPKNRNIDNQIPITYVPFRNGIFLAISVAYAEKLDISNIIGGWNVLDYSGYPDCRPDFLESFRQAATLGTKIGQTKPFNIIAPLIGLKKSEIIKLGKKHNADYSYAYSCYEGNEIPCGQCDSCILRAKGFEEAGFVDDYMVRLATSSKETKLHP